MDAHITTAEAGSSEHLFAQTTEGESLFIGHARPTHFIVCHTWVAASGLLEVTHQVSPSRSARTDHIHPLPHGRVAVHRPCQAYTFHSLSHLGRSIRPVGGHTPGVTITVSTDRPYPSSTKEASIESILFLDWVTRACRGGPFSGSWCTFGAIDLRLQGQGRRRSGRSIKRH